MSLRYQVTLDYYDGRESKARLLEDPPDLHGVLMLLHEAGVYGFTLTKVEPLDRLKEKLRVIDASR